VLLAKTKEYKKIKSLKLKISTTNLNKPNIYLTFLENGTLKHKEKIINDVYDWVTRIETIKNSKNVQNIQNNSLLNNFNF
jgi:hypothetical protein